MKYRKHLNALGTLVVVSALTLPAAALGAESNFQVFSASKKESGYLTNQCEQALAKALEKCVHKGFSQCGAMLRDGSIDQGRAHLAVKDEFQGISIGGIVRNVFAVPLYIASASYWDGTVPLTMPKAKCTVTVIGKNINEVAMFDPAVSNLSSKTTQEMLPADQVPDNAGQINVGTASPALQE
ncbi:MAG: hypothetical protein A2428_07670 [Bdellovibrionales bacterium RIFOXYC1_FULL_54_43]|nr:MAG: hypothetical protein A2428_07670 [Bdellovibrionales bacterium RIFOXYC1_FULL_54_43]OFZ79512.1 MAG: hypothetical protein A2603_09895 [Bdellovibrionales bacterium RIFOXYD1_FULL_55_31]